MIDLIADEETPRCRKCGKWTKHKVELASNDVPVLVGRLCNACFEDALDRLYELRKEFEALLAEGIDRERANEIMIDRIEERERIESAWRPSDKET